MKRILLYEQHTAVIKDPIFLYCKSERMKELLGNKRADRLFNLMKGHNGVGYDILNNKLEKAPLEEGKTSHIYIIEDSKLSPRSLDNKITILTNKISSNYKYLDSYVPGNGWIKVWEDKGKPGEISNITKNYDTKLFELGKYKITDDFKKTLQNDINEVKSNYEIIEVTIQSSTDKTPLTPQLKKELSDLGYSQDNEGLSKARSNEISSVLVENKIPQDIIKVDNLYEQGSSPKSEEERLELVKNKKGYDPSARYVNIIFKVKSKSGEDFLYFQKINFGSKKGKVKKSLIPFMDYEEGHCGYE